jgi:hypothetical protein
VVALSIRKVADKSVGSRVRRYDPVTGQPKLVNPDTPGEEHEPWPLAGVEFVGDPPEQTTVATRYVDNAIAQGWATRVNERPVVRPAGPTMGDWNSSHSGSPHVFLHADEVVFHTTSGDVRYKVTHQPDKYVADGNERTKMTADHYEAGNSRVDHFYGLERIDG